MNGVAKSVELQFGYEPQGQDMTWIFWVVIALIAIVIAYSTGFLKTVYANPMMLVPVIIGIAILWVLWLILNILTGISDTMEGSWGYITTLGGLLK